MNKLPNEVTNLLTFRMPDGTPIQGAKLFEVSRFWPSKNLGGTSIDDLLAAEYNLQQAAVSAGLIKPGAELQPHYAKEILEDKTEKGYTVMAVTVPRETPPGYEVVAMVRPDIAVAGGEGYVKLWFTPIVHPDFVRATIGEGEEKPRLFPLRLDTFLMYEAIARIKGLKNNEGKPVVGDDPLVFADDQGSMKTRHLRNRGFRVLIDNVGVPDLAAKGSGLYHAAHQATLLVKPNQKYSSSVPLPMAIEMARTYQHDGFGVPLTAQMVKETTQRLEQVSVLGHALLGP